MIITHASAPGSPSHRVRMRMRWGSTQNFYPPRPQTALSSASAATISAVPERHKAARCRQSFATTPLLAAAARPSGLCVFVCVCVCPSLVSQLPDSVAQSVHPRVRRGRKALGPGLPGLRGKEEGEHRPGVAEWLARLDDQRQDVHAIPGHAALLWQEGQVVPHRRH